MRGHWESQTRKLNRHYQSVSDAWDPNNPNHKWLVALEKDEERYYVAPSYCCVRDGAMVKAVEYPPTETFEATTVEDITMCKLEDFIMTPYFPKTSDDFYVGNTEDVSFVVGKDFDLKTYTYNNEITERETICSYKAGQNLSDVEANFLIITYSVYVTRKNSLSTYTEDELTNIQNIIKARPRLDGSPVFNKDFPSGESDIYGNFTAAIHRPNQDDNLNFMNNLTSNTGIYGSDIARRIIYYPARTLQPLYFQNRFFNGEQTVTKMFSKPVNSSIASTDGGMAGFYPGKVDTTAIFDITGWIKPWFVLKEIKTMKGSVTGW